MARTSPLDTQKALRRKESMWLVRVSVDKPIRSGKVGLRQEHLNKGLQESTGLWGPAEVPELEPGG